MVATIEVRAADAADVPREMAVADERADRSRDGDSGGGAGACCRLGRTRLRLGNRRLDNNSPDTNQSAFGPAGSLVGLCRNIGGEAASRWPGELRRIVGRGPDGKIEGGSLRLYSPQSGQWSLNYANLRNGLLTSPTFGAFDASGRGAFFGQDTVDGRTVLVRFIITRPSPDEAHFEQAYSADGGATWEDNWIAVDKRR